MNQHWDNLYSQTQDLYGISPNHFIQQIADQVPIVGKTLAIAEGEGRNILYLANKAKQQNDSFSAEIWDYSKVALQHLSAKAQQAGFDFTLRNIDLNDVEWPRECYQNVMCVYGHFDENTQFNVLTGIRQALTNNGWFIGELYSKEQIDYQTGGPKDINYLYDPMSFLSVFKNDHLYHFYVGEQERHEGKLHNGKCHVVQFAIQVKK